MLVVFPLGLFATSVVFDLLYLIHPSGSFPLTSFWNIAAGVAGGLLAVVLGFWNWLAIPPGTRAKQIGAIHGMLNVIVIALFAFSWTVRKDLPGYEPTGLALGLSLVGAVIALVLCWLGGELVGGLGVAEYADAALDAPRH
jgi:uncharacterized membrane protein